MPRCSCAGNSCSCLISQGPGIQVGGTGNASSPYVISLSSDQDPVDFSSDGILDLSQTSMVGAVLISLNADATSVILPAAGGRVDLLLRQGGAGTNTVAWPAEIIWASDFTFQRGGR